MIHGLRAKVLKDVEYCTWRLTEVFCKNPATFY